MASVSPGDILACKYRVERVLGSGGMGVVVAARHKQLGHLVAIKLLRQGLGTVDDAEATARFVREAKAAAMLKSEHIARVYDVDTLDTGQPFIVMEYLEGTDLAELSMQRGPLPVFESVAYLLEACEGLAEAHACGIIHRDIKPANLFITQTAKGTKIVKVLDFGVSKMNLLGDGEHDITRTSAMLGSPRFMSPEQLRDARTVDARSDVWSLGVVLYRLVSGRPPFDGKKLGSVIASILNDKPAPLTATIKNLPPGFESIVLRCLEKDPAKRFASVADFASALTPYAGGAGGAGGASGATAVKEARATRVAPARPIARTSRPQAKVFLGALLALLALAAFTIAAASAKHFFLGWAKHSRAAVEIENMPPSIASTRAPLDPSVPLSAQGEAPAAEPVSRQTLLPLPPEPSADQPKTAPTSIAPPAPKATASAMAKPARSGLAPALRAAPLPAVASQAASSDSGDSEIPSTRE